MDPGANLHALGKEKSILLLLGVKLLLLNCPSCANKQAIHRFYHEKVMNCHSVMMLCHQFVETVSDHEYTENDLFLLHTLCFVIWNNILGQFARTSRKQYFQNSKKNYKNYY